MSTVPIAQGLVDVNVRRQDCYAEDGAPVKCWKCGGTEQREEVRSMVDVLRGQGPVLEYEIFCAECGTGIGYWAHGYFDPGYVRDVTANALGQEPCAGVCARSPAPTGCASRDNNGELT